MIIYKNLRDVEAHIIESINNYKDSRCTHV